MTLPILLPNRHKGYWLRFTKTISQQVGGKEREAGARQTGPLQAPPHPGSPHKSTRYALTRNWTPNPFIFMKEQGVVTIPRIVHLPCMRLVTIACTPDLFTRLLQAILEVFMLKIPSIMEHSMSEFPYFGSG